MAIRQFKISICLFTCCKLSLCYQGSPEKPDQQEIDCLIDLFIYDEKLAHPIWRLRSPRICYLQAEYSEKPVALVAVWVQKPEIQVRWWISPNWSAEDRCFRLGRQARRKAINSSFLHLHSIQALNGLNNTRTHKEGSLPSLVHRIKC